MHRLLELIKSDMRPAFGVTEPGAIAFAAARAREEVEGKVRKVKISLNSGMYKNAYTCGIPNSDKIGNRAAAALGIVAGDASLGLEALSHVTEEDNKNADALLKEGIVDVELSHMGSKIFINALVKSEKDWCLVEIRDSHTDIRRITKNGKILYEKQEKCEEEKLEKPLIHAYTLAELVEIVETADEEDLSFIKEAFYVNLALLKEGLDSGKAVFAEQLLKENQSRLISDDERSTAQLLCNGAIEARVQGCGRAAMSITGSGAHGIIAAMPLYGWYKINEKAVKEIKLLRATTLSFLITTYIKEYSGKLSAFCGCGIAAGTGMACGLAYLKGGGMQQIKGVICNMAAGITGMICDGGNHGCVMKGITAVDAAFRSVDMAMNGIFIRPPHGIVGNTPEDTMKNMGRIAFPGMTATEETIVKIMEEK
ncbi:L-cysteine desulfidase family protein [Lachnoclostridium sp. An181]|uniref:L-cysteine desulfidase family protein n=1 Tax=Lachnoclostridium sp. An181 TaxID=1965575 RepID=UPI000B38C6E6|nr:L-serine ammonia-lyase, iron-sulfur-dependent, subunit alpha [Lachnoclostridium sp. An181]OUP49343.1 hypothetical protein B5F18_08045 [Lachnoclostridium sp. An181]